MLGSFLTKEFLGIFQVWQLIPLVLMIILLIFWKIYRNKQM